jgi:transcriptional regulator with XRE-family HTH domain
LRKLNKNQKGGESMDHSKLRGLIREKFSTQEAFAQAIGRSACAVSQKLNGKAEWSAVEIRRTCEVLEIPPEQIPLYFFCPKS